jgi:hypothetical protein
MRSFHIITTGLLIATGIGMCCIRNKTALRAHHPRPCSPIKVTCGNEPIRRDGIVLPIEPIAQEEKNWCSIAAFAMLRTYFGSPVRQCQIANERTFFPPPLSSTVADDNGCCDPAAVHLEFCARPTLVTSDFDRLFATSGLYAIPLERTLTEHEIKRELSNGRPIIISYHFRHDYCEEHPDVTDCYGHTMLLTGFLPPNTAANTATATAYVLLDPADGTERQSSYAVLVRGAIIEKAWPWTDGETIVVPYPWTYSWMRIAPHANGCIITYDLSCIDASTDTATAPEAP